jgi:hypothetical protein
MTLCEATRQRIETVVPDLAKRVEEIADLAALIRQKQLPAHSPWAFVVPAGIDGGVPDAATGVYRQHVKEVVGVILVLQVPGDPKARRALATLDDLIVDVIQAVCGWSPDDDSIGVFELRRGRLLSVDGGNVMYQLDFSMDDQLRITGS